MLKIRTGKEVKRMAWKLYKGGTEILTTTEAPGDETAPPTRFYNRLQLALWGWKTAAVFAVSEEDADARYYVGFAPKKGRPMISTTILNRRQVALRIGHEACRFFARNEQGEPVRLSLIMSRVQILRFEPWWHWAGPTMIEVLGVGDQQAAEGFHLGFVNEPGGATISQTPLHDTRVALLRHPTTHRRCFAVGSSYADRVNLEQISPAPGIPLL